ncbi:MAG: hypothetical protein II896_04850 [Clostridia bacterium]|nr:hypothetical protein [Clostridia bacterium]
MTTLLNTAFEQAGQSIRDISTNLDSTPHDLPAGISGWGVLGMTILALFIVAALFVGSMALYFYCRRRFSHRRWLIEIGFIGCAIAICAALNVFLYCYAGAHDISYAKAIAFTFHGLFNGMGHLTFNGADATAEGLSHGFICVYYGSALYAALMFFGILSSSANYEFYSYLMLRFRKENGKNIYVFTALNNETLLLAKDIVKYNGGEDEEEDAKQDAKEKNDEKKKEKANKTKCVVVFAIPTPKPFDRRDELCREVMANGFLYVSYSAETSKRRLFITRLFTKQKKKTVSIADIMCLNNHNYLSCDNEFCVFAFDSDDYLPNEERNMAMVFADIDCRIQADKNDGMRISYYILTNRQINYAAYDYKLRELRVDYYKKLQKLHANERSGESEEVESYLLSVSPSAKNFLKNATPPFKKAADFFSAEVEDVKRFMLAQKEEQEQLKNGVDKAKWKMVDKVAKVVTEAFARRFIVSVWNEPDVIAKAIVEKSTHLLKTIFARPDRDVTVMSLGFGGTGLAATMAMYSHAAYVDERFEANRYTAHIYDLDADRIGKCVANERPYCLVSFVGENGSSTPYRGRKNTNLHDQISQLQTEFVKGEKANGKTPVPSSVRHEDLAKEMKYPILNFHAENCQDLDFLRAFDDEGGATRPDFVFVATGDDYANVRMANAITQKIVNTSLLQPQRPMDVFVVIWDNTNNDLLSSGGGKWIDKYTVSIEDAKRNAGEILRLHIIGNNDRLYSAKNTIVFSEPIAFHNQYEEIADYDQKDDFADWCIRANIADADGTAVRTQKDRNGLPKTEKDTAQRKIDSFNTHFYHTIARARTEEKNDAGVYVTAMTAEAAAMDDASARNATLRKTAMPADIAATTEESTARMLLWISKYTARVNALPGYVDNLDQRLKYLVLDLWRKESNAMVALNCDLYHYLLADCFRLNDEALPDGEKLARYAQLASLEHQRWTRFHIANGWVYSGQKEKFELVYQHGCILPYAYVKEDTVLYDLSNVLMAWKYGKPTE